MPTPAFRRMDSENNVITIDMVDDWTWRFTVGDKTVHKSSFGEAFGEYVDHLMNQGIPAEEMGEEIDVLLEWLAEFQRNF